MSGLLPLTSETVLRRISSGEYTLRDKEGVKKSNVWDLFKAVYDTNTNLFVNYVQCVRCCTLYTFKSGSSTSNLQKHTSKCAGSSSDSNIDTDTVSPQSSSSQLERSEEALAQEPQAGPSTAGRCRTPKQTCRTRTKAPKEFPRHANDEITDLCVKFCAIDLRPFNVVNGAGFKNLAQALINVGADYGKVDAMTVLPHSSTVSRKTNSVAAKVKEQFLPEVKAATKNKSCAFDSDMWSDKYTKTAYLTVTAQYITPEFDLKSLVLFTTDFPADQAKTGENIKKHIIAEAEILGITMDDLADVTFVTDQGSNMKAALSNNTRLPCTAHCLATVLRHLFDDKFLTTEAPLTKMCLDVCRNLVNFLKRSGLSRLLERSVKTMLEVRWDTVLDMLESVCDMLPNIIAILDDRKETKRLDGWDGEHVTELVHFLSLFKKVSKELQAKKVPTLHLVVVRYYDLLRHCNPNEGDSEEIIILKQKATALITEKIVLYDEHLRAAILCPNVRSLNYLDPPKRIKAHDALISKINALPRNEPQDLMQPPTKKGRFESWEEDDSGDYTPEEELELYLKTGKSDSDNPSDLLSWWKQKSLTYPRLAKIAQQIFAIPATSASSERNFSRAGIIVSERRSRISPKTVNDLLLIHNFYLGQKADSQIGKSFFEES